MLYLSTHLDNPSRWVYPIGRYEGKNIFYIVKRNAFGDYLFWHAHHKNFRYSGGSSYASLESAKKAFCAIISTYNIDPAGVEVVSHEAVLNNYNKVTSIA